MTLMTADEQDQFVKMLHSITGAEAPDFSRGRKRGPHGLTY
jgi:hypothetical protein